MTSDEAPASKPVLYVDPVSPPCRAVGMVCRLGKIDVDVKELSIFNGEHKTDAMKLINPVGTLPFLVDGELKMNDSQAIAVHLVRKYAPKSKLHGADVQERAKVDELLCDAKEVQTVFYAKMVILKNDDFLSKYLIREQFDLVAKARLMHKWSKL